MKVKLNITERMLLIQLFSSINSPMRTAKLGDKIKYMEMLELDEEEKKDIDYKENKDKAVKRADFDRDKAKEIIKEYNIVGWALDLIQTWLHYSEVLDDMQQSHYSLYSKFCLETKKE